MGKKTICWITPDYFSQVDDTVLCHLVERYSIIWYYICEETLGRARLGRANAQKYADKYGIELHIVDPKMRYRNPKNFFFYRDIVKEINGRNPDLVYYTDRNPYWALAIRLYLKCKTLVMGIHDAQAHSVSFSMSRLLEMSSKDLVLGLQDNFVTFSPNQQELFLKVYNKKSAMVGMSYKDFGPSDKKLPLFTEGVKLLFFGSIEDYKGLDILISALEIMREDGISNISLTIAGQGPFWTKCEPMVKTLEMYNLQIRFIDNSEIPDLMSTNHFLVLPYRNATQSGPLVAALAYELPVIAPSFGCFTEIHNDESAVLYANGELEMALRKVSRMTEDEYFSMKVACGKIKQANSEESIAKNYMSYFDSLLNKKI